MRCVRLNLRVAKAEVERVDAVLVEGVRVSYFTEMCSGSEAVSYLRLIDVVYHSTLSLRVIKKKEKKRRAPLWSGK